MGGPSLWLRTRCVHTAKRMRSHAAQTTSECGPRSHPKRVLDVYSVRPRVIVSLRIDVCLEGTQVRSGCLNRCLKCISWKEKKKKTPDPNKHLVRTGNT